MKIFKLLTQITVFLGLAFPAYSGQISITAESLRLDCKRLSHRLPKSVFVMCNADGSPAIYTKENLKIHGSLVTTQHLSIQAMSLELDTNAKIYSPSFFASTEKDILINGNISSKEIQLVSKGQLMVNAVLSAKNRMELNSGQNVVVNGVLSSQRGLLVRAKNIQLEKNSDLNSSLAFVELFADKQIEMRSNQVLADKVKAYSSNFLCEQSQIIAKRQILIHHNNQGIDQQSTKLNSCLILRKNSLQDVFEDFDFYEDLFWGKAEQAETAAYSNREEISIVSEGNITGRNTKILSPSKQINIFARGKVDIPGNDFGSSSAHNTVTVDLQGGWVQLDSIVVGKTVNVVQHKIDGLLENNGIIFGSSETKTLATNSNKNAGMIYSGGEAVFFQGSKTGECINTGNIRSNNLTMECHGLVDLGKGYRRSIERIKEVFPQGITAANPGKTITKKLEHYSPLTAELINAYADTIMFTGDIKPEDGLYLVDTELDPEKVLNLNKSMTLDAGLHIKSPSLKVLENVAINVAGDLSLNATVGDIEILHSTKLTSKNQATFIANRSIIKMSKLEEEPKDPKTPLVFRAEIEAGKEGVRFKAVNYAAQGAVVNTPGKMIMDITGEVNAVPLVYRYEDTDLVRSDIFGKKTRTTVIVKNFNPEWNVGDVVWEQAPKKAKLVNVTQNGQDYELPEITRAEIGEDNLEVDKIEDQHYSYTTYSPTLATEIVRRGLEAIAAYYSAGNPAVIALVNTVTEPLATDESLTLQNAISNFATNLAVYAVSQTDNQITANVSSGVVRAVIKGEEYTAEQLLSAIVNGHISNEYLSKALQDKTFLQKRFFENLAYQAVNNVVYQESLNLNEFFGNVLNRSVVDAMGDYAYDETTKALKEYDRRSARTKYEQVNQASVDQENQLGDELLMQLPEDARKELILSSFENLNEISKTAAQNAFGVSFEELRNNPEMLNSERFRQEFRAVFATSSPKNLQAVVPVALAAALATPEGIAILTAMGAGLTYYAGEAMSDVSVDMDLLYPTALTSLADLYLKSLIKSPRLSPISENSADEPEEAFQLLEFVNNLISKGSTISANETTVTQINNSKPKTTNILPQKGDIVTGEGIDLKDPTTWPKPPVIGDVRVGSPSRNKPNKRGEKSFFDENGGEWRPAKPDRYHEKGHWDYKPPGKNTQWQNVYK